MRRLSLCGTGAARAEKGNQLEKPYFVFDDRLSVSMETKQAATQLPASHFLVFFKALKNQRKGEVPLPSALKVWGWGVSYECRAGEGFNPTE